MSWLPDNVAGNHKVRALSKRGRAECERCLKLGADKMPIASPRYAFNAIMVAIKCETVCLHGDGDHAVEFASLIREKFETEGFTIAPAGG